MAPGEARGWTLPASGHIFTNQPAYTLFYVCFRLKTPTDRRYCPMSIELTTSRAVDFLQQHFLQKPSLLAGRNARRSTFARRLFQTAKSPTKSTKTWRMQPWTGTSMCLQCGLKQECIVQAQLGTCTWGTQIFLPLPRSSSDHGNAVLISGLQVNLQIRNH